MAQPSGVATDEIAGGKARLAFERAIRVELDAIERHEEAARHHEQIALLFEQNARTRGDDLVRREAAANAVSARQRAANARARAAGARQRLQDEGVDVLCYRRNGAR